eukprot:5032564-Heterocapsa_arctica.AAC.1
MPALIFKPAIDGFAQGVEEYPALAESARSRVDESSAAIRATREYSRKFLSATLVSRPSLGDGQRLTRFFYPW